MLRQPHTSERDENCAIDVTVMLDVVFILLVFFIVTASFVREFGVDIMSPQTDHADGPKTAPLFIEIDANHELWAELQPVDVRRIRAHMENGQFLRPGSGVVIVPRPQSSKLPLIQVLDASGQAHIYDINLARRDF